MEDERSRFEKWFRSAYGNKPQGNAEGLSLEIRKLQEKLYQLNIYEAEYKAALSAWSERHSRKEKKE